MHIATVQNCEGESFQVEKHHRFQIVVTYRPGSKYISKFDVRKPSHETGLTLFANERCYETDDYITSRILWQWACERDDVHSVKYRVIDVVPCVDSVGNRVPPAIVLKFVDTWKTEMWGGKPVKPYVDRNGDLVYD